MDKTNIIPDKLLLIGITRKQKEELLILASAIMLETKKRVYYSDVIQMLLDKYKEKNKGETNG